MLVDARAKRDTIASTDEHFPAHAPPMPNLRSTDVNITVLMGMCCVAVASALPGCSDKPPPANPVPDAVESGELQEDPLADFELDPDRQKVIWDAEHITFAVEHHFGKRFLDALRERQAEQLTAMFVADASATIVPVAEPTIREHEGVIEQRWSADVQGTEKADAREFVSQLVAGLQDFDQLDRTQFRVLQIRQSPEEPPLWSTRILIAVAGSGEAGALLESTSEHDVDFAFEAEEALEQDPVIKRWTTLKRELRICPGPLMVEATQEFGLDRVRLADNWELPQEEVLQYRFQMAVADYDGDGWLDLAIAEKHRSQIYHFDPQARRFVDVTPQTGIAPMHVMLGNPVDLAGWIDYDNDDYPDLLLGNRLYHNEQGRRFRDVTSASQLNFKRQAMGVHVADYDCDGLLDLYILYQASAETALPKSTLRWIEEDDYGEPNELWRNLGEGRFENVTEQANAGGGRRHTLAGTWFFYDDDRYPDLYLANDLSKNVLLRNRGDGTFEDLSQQSEASDFATSMGVAAGDTDNDGTSDLYVANMFSKMGRRIIGNVSEDDYPPGVFEQIQGSCAGNRLYKRAPQSKSYEEYGEQFGISGVGWAYAPAMADFDADGWLDLYATTGFLSFTRGKPDG